MSKSIKCYFAVFFISLLVVSSTFWPNIADAGEPRVSCHAAVLMDAKTGQVYYAKNPDEHRSPASLTKIMTAILAIELGNPNDIVTVGKRAQNIYVGSQIHLKAGEKLTLDDLTTAALMYSANDSTVAIAEHVGGTHDIFVYLMNKKALALGAIDTRYVNTNGYSVPNHYSTAHDLATLTRYALQNETFAKKVSTKEATIHWVDSDREKTIRNTNGLLKQDYPGVDGVKTGTTARAGKCLIASATRGDRQLIAVVLHSSNRYRDAAKLLEYGFNEFEEQMVVEKGDVFGEVEVIEGDDPRVLVVSKESLQVMVPVDGSKMGYKMHLPESVAAPVKENQHIGYLTVYFDDRELGQVPLVAAKEVDEQSWLSKLWQSIKS